MPCKEVRRDQVRESRVALADCVDCKWTYGNAAPHRTLARGRAHAHKHKHLVLVHRSTEYDGREAT